MPPTLQILRTANPTTVTTFPYGRFETFRIGSLEVGRATYSPGWHWTAHVGPLAGTTLCEVDHVGVVISGRAAVRMRDGEEWLLMPGDFFSIPPGHDSWVVGSDDYVSLHLLGAGAYASAVQADAGEAAT